MASFIPEEVQESLDEVDIHGVLSNERRRMTLEILSEEEGTISARELSERIAELETGQQPPPRNIRQSAYVSLIQTHLPKLDELDIVEYDNGSKSVTLSRSAEQVSGFMESAPQTVADEHYLIVSLMGLVIMLAAKAGLSPIDLNLAGNLAILFFLVITGAAVIRANANDWPLYSRFRDQ